ncbi:MAG: hypothetical protein Q3979_01010 [Actinomycetaceae bacterium]|nr:hypothetical protein [Actinomycetaceae bacterium]
MDRARAFAGRPEQVGATLALLLLAAHIALGSFDWRYEWATTSMSYAFSAATFGPAVGGYCAWRSMGRGRTMRGASGAESARAFVRDLNATVGPMLAIWVAGAAVAFACTFVTTRPSGLRADVLWPLGSAGLAIYLCGAIGLTVGLRATYAWTALLVAIAQAGVIMFSRGTPLGPLVAVGGRTASLVGLAPAPAYHACQTAAYALCTLALVAWHARGRGGTAGSPLGDGIPRGHGGDGRRRLGLLGRSGAKPPAGWSGTALAGALSLIAAATCAGLVLASPSRLTERQKASDLACATADSGRRYCVGSGYRALLPELVSRMEAAAASVEPYAGAVGRQWNQNGVLGGASWDARAVMADRRAAVRFVLADLVPPRCDMTRLGEEWSIAVAGVSPSNDDEGAGSAPERYRQASPSRREELVRQSVQALRACAPTDQ